MFCYLMKPKVFLKDRTIFHDLRINKLHRIQILLRHLLQINGTLFHVHVHVFNDHFSLKISSFDL